MRPIDADALIEQLAEVAQRANKNAAYTGNRSSELTWDMAVKYIKNAPTSEQKKGKWIITDTYNNQIWHCNCSECGKDPQYFISGTEDWWINKLPNFCPNCGADLKEVE